ncbi:DUF7288 family protein [Halalkalicoccus subterraneus]|uniref:DUF7288 family protein n=1 Tax=Halalkalicoccus subterraneus TaxID=2675002 RepID=UPI000EFB5453|nr:hypothetical protein [Halalkalicoccus subterraneus]
MRGQAHTLEAFAAAALLVTSLLFAMQVTAVTPLSASTSSQGIENQQRTATEDALRIADGEDELGPTVLHWDNETRAFHGLEPGEQYAPGELDTALGERLDATFADRGIAYNLYVHYPTDGGARESRRVVHSGEPSDHAASATRLLTLYGDDELRGPDGSATGVSLIDSESFYVEPAGESSFYAVVEVEVVVWRL